MITHCPHCNTEFLLEDNDMPSGGLSLECAVCNQVFGVLAPAVNATPAPGPTKAAARKLPPPDTDPDATPLPIPPPLPAWRLKRETGEMLVVDHLDTLKHWISENRVRRDDLISRDGVAWQRLANMRELIPSFEHAERHPDATRLVERHAFVVNVGGAEAGEGALRATGSWPGPNAPLVVEEPPRRTSTSYAHDKTHPFIAPVNHLHRDYPALWRRQQWVRWTLGGTVGLTVGLGLILWVEPQWLHRVAGAVYHASVPDVAVTLVHQGYGQMYPDTVASLQAAVQTFKRATAVAGHYAEAHAGLAEAQITLAETYRLQSQPGLRGPDKKHARAARPMDQAELEKQASAALQAGLAEAQTALRLGPESVAANRAMALYHEVAGSEAARAAPFLHQARAGGPDDPRVMYVESSSPDVAPLQAIEMYRNVVERLPQFNRARYKLARLYAQQNDMQHAHEQARAILAAAPGHALARALLGDASEAASGLTVVSNLPGPGVDDNKRGAAQRNMAGDLPPGTPYDALIHEGQLLRATHQLPAAVAMYERAIARDKRRAAGYIGLGWCLLEQDKSGSAMLNFTYATELSPWSVEAHYGLAEALRAEGDLQQAIKQYRQVLVIEPDGAMGHLARQVLDEISR